MTEALIDAPLVLISQIQRSGGSMLAQLFDGHPQVYAHPLELRMWHPRKGDWPVLDPAGDPREWWVDLRHYRWRKLGESGFVKAGRNPFAAQLSYPFTYSEVDHRARFLALARSRPVRTSRDVLDCWFTSWFASWGEWEPTGREVAITGFMPQLVMRPASLGRFRDDYPDGGLISIVRDPVSWYASTSRHSGRHGDLQEATAEWVACATAIRDLAQAGTPWLQAILFEDLVTEPEPVMRRLAAFAGIEFDPCLLEPSYLGQPMLPNSSFAVSEGGINAAMAERGDQLDPDDRRYIEAEATPLYEELGAVLRAPAAG